ncbi:MAG: phosphoribosylformylglycinamidine synthase subunit PurS, partial [Planctomycetota bacterium]
MIHRIEIRGAEGFLDPHAAGVHHQIHELGIDGVTEVRSVRLFFLIGELNVDDARRIAEELLSDPVTERYSFGSSEVSDGSSVVEVHLKAGVMDPVAASATEAIGDMNLPIDSVRTGKRYELEGDLNDETLGKIARRLLANPVIEDIHFEPYTPPEVHTHEYEFKIVDVPIRELDDEGLEKLSADGEMFLNLTEMKAIRDYYRRVGREPRDVELEMIAQTWSEHCVHKTFRSDVCVRDRAGNVVEEIPNLLKSTVFAVTKQLEKPWCLSVFEDNAGVIEFDDQNAICFKVETHNHPSAIEPYGGNAICFKVETHNHPSAIEPYGGAATGIGGVIRDPMGTGLGAKPVANTDIFCFGPPDIPLDEVPKGVLHPRRVMRGVVGGVRDYGNRMGIPTVNGAVYFDEKYLGNPLVYCGTIGLMPIGMARKRQP